YFFVKLILGLTFYLQASRQDDGEQYRITPPTERNNIQVSVVIPVYNTAPWLDEALSSIANQTLREIEIICIDDGSTDESLEILERLAAQDSRFVLFSRPNAGLSCARNLGIAQARGKFLYFMDSDDWLEQDALEQSVAVMREKALDVLFFDWTNDYESEELAESFSRFQINDTRSRAYDDVCEGQTLLHRFCEENNYSGIVWRQILRTDFVRENALSFPPGLLYEDNPFTFAVLLKAKRTFHLRRTYYHYRVREGSITTKAILFYNVYSHYQCFLDMFQIYLEAAPDLTPENRNAALRRVAAMLNNTRSSFAKMSPEYEFSELGLRENLYTFQMLVSNGVRESQRTKELNEKLRKINAEKSELNQKLRKTNAEKSELNQKLQKTYAEKSELNQKLQKTYDEKHDRGVQIRRLTKKNEELQEKLKKTYDEKYDRGVQIRQLNKDVAARNKEIAALKQEVAALRKKNKAQEKKLNKLRRSASFRIGRVLTWPVRKTRALIKRLGK
ncbi:MAG: glycosyltransferase, partial [Clostridiales bacterium]|nr:glycosyltransferase [Clostridiales bacterium]